MDKPLTTKELDPRSLRILILLNLEWNPRLGAVRVYLELADQWRAAGHKVEHFSLSEAFPRASSSRVGFAIRQLLFAYKAAAFVKKNATRFDVIDALIGSLPMSKKALGFTGLLVARSVGLYRLYDRFELHANQRWPRRQRGKFLGRIFYRAARRLLRHASDKAIEHADLTNLPNESEAECIRRELGSGYQIVVQPYGLSQQQRSALKQRALPAQVRLAQKKIAFIGMWAARKGAHDWANIIAHVRSEIPDAQFSFLGTMVDSRVVADEVGPPSKSGVESVSEYAPDELPRLLSDCAVAAFPSYVEGFGLAVLEQLAAGIPTVAFDVPGPANVLGRNAPELLVPAGDTKSLARTICDLLRLDPSAYDSLSEICVEIAAEFDWTKIAEDTIRLYRDRLDYLAQRPIIFVQPFSLGAAGGGSRILRALLNDAPLHWHSVCCSPKRSKPWPNETHLPSRPFWGKIETSRLAMFPKKTMSMFAPGFRRRLKSLCQSCNARAIHAIPHSGIDFAHAQTVARELSLPFFISVHDDLAYTAIAEVGPEMREPAMARAWLESDARFVISESLGREYSRRYGPRLFEIVTDGIAELNSRPRKLEGGSLRIYFMGLFHLAYERNLRALLDGISLFRQHNSAFSVQIRCRCEYIRSHVFKDGDEVEVLPFATEAQIERDLEESDLLYLPMPFGSEHESFARYSISTKMVTYVGSGVPILYHGPTTSAAFDLLDRHRAAIFVTTLDANAIAVGLQIVADGGGAEISANAMELARHQFILADQTKRFWGTVSKAMGAL